MAAGPPERLTLKPARSQTCLLAWARCGPRHWAGVIKSLSAEKIAPGIAIQDGTSPEDNGAVTDPIEDEPAPQETAQVIQEPEPARRKSA